MTTSQKFTEAKLEQAIIELRQRQDYPYRRGTDLERWPSDVLIRSDLRKFLASRYAADQVLESAIDSIIRQLDALNSADLYDSNNVAQLSKLIAGASERFGEAQCVPMVSLVPQRAYDSENRATLPHNQLRIR